MGAGCREMELDPQLQFIAVQTECIGAGLITAYEGDVRLYKQMFKGVCNLI